MTDHTAIQETDEMKAQWAKHIKQGASMTNQQLLELAAKATSLNIKAQSVNADDRWIGFIVGEKHTREKKFWNPLEDDGDALRLAVKLKLSLYTPFWGHANFAEVGIREHDGEVKSICREYNDDSYAATRRAIVRAAAEIGKGMEVMK
jgi:hypothetical protein